MQTIRFSNFEFHPSQKILDIGCGQGRHCFGAYMQANLDVFGLDMGKEDVRKAKQNFVQFDEGSSKKSCIFLVGNAKKLPFADNSFDHVVCSEVLEHIIDFESALKEIKRVLKSDGTFALSVPKFFPEWICWKLSKDYQNEPGGHVRIFKYKELKNSELPEEIRIGAVLRNNEIIIPRSNFIFKKDDKIVFLAKKDQLETVENLFRISSF